MSHFKLGFLLASGIALSAVVGCDAQVGDEYTGETILTLQGNVKLRDTQTDSDLLPALVFFGNDGFTVVDGDTTGEFPSRFRFDVSQPPPDAAYLAPDPSENVNGQMAIGFIAMLPPEHPRQLATTSLGDICSEGATMCNFDDTSCDDAGHCRTRSYQCEQHPCDLLDEVGEPLASDNVASSSADLTCYQDTCLTVDTECPREGDCHVQFYQCERTSWADQISADGTEAACKLTDETGDPSIVASDDLDALASNYYVVFVSEDSPDATLGSLKRGYNVIEVVQPSAEDWMKNQLCALDVRRQFVTDYNAKHGTDWGVFLTPDELDTRIADKVETECGASVEYRVVDDPADTQLTLEVGADLPL